MFVFSLIIRFLLLTSAFLAAAEAIGDIDSKTPIFKGFMSGVRLFSGSVRQKPHFYAVNVSESRAVIELKTHIRGESKNERAHRDVAGPSWAAAKTAVFDGAQKVNFFWEKACPSAGEKYRQTRIVMEMEWMLI